MNLPEKRHTVESLFVWKVKVLSKIAEMQRIEKDLESDFEEIGKYTPVHIDMRSVDMCQKNAEEKYVDFECWGYLVKIFYLERYMLCTDYKKLLKEIEEYKTPQFTIENANAWIASLKALIYENVNTLVKNVFSSLTEEIYYTGGSSYSTRAKKKRNNNGVDKQFIIHTGDHYRIHSYTGVPSITDDLEKVCYILSGRSLPEITAIRTMYNTHLDVFENDLFSLKVCKNGNTHYALSDEVREKLNRFGPSGAIIGENIKIKIIEDRW